MGKSFWALAWSCGLWLLLAPAFAVGDDAAFRVYRLGDSVAPAADVLAGKLDAAAREIPGQVIKPTPHVGGWWRLDILRDVPADPSQVLVLDAPNHTTTSVWLPGRAMPSIRATSGPNSDASYGPRLAVFALPGGMRAGQRVYLYVTSSASSADRLRIADEHAVRVRDRHDAQVNTLIHGTLLALVLVGLGLGLTLREADFLILGCGLGFALLFLLDNTVDLYRIPGMAPLADVRTLQRILGSSAAFFTGLFMLRYLQMDLRAPRLARVQRWMLGVYVLVVVASYVPLIGRLPWPMVGNVALLVSVIVGFIVGVKGALDGDRPSRVFLWSWLPLLVSLAWRVLEINLRWAPNEMLEYAFPASFVLAGVLLMIGLGDRMLAYKRERDASNLLARRDPLTEVANRRALDESLRVAAHEASERGHPLALLFVDLDHFKRINDTHGHDVGDACLREVARRLRVALRFGDVLGRYGGEEFVIGLPRTPVEEAGAIAERIRVAIGAQPIACDERTIAVTVSIGIAIVHEGLSGLGEAIRRADRALFASKHAGRDRVSVLMD